MKQSIREKLALRNEGNILEKEPESFHGKTLRDSRGRWVKGVSGNDLGRPRTALAELCRQQISKHDLVAVLGGIASRTGDYDKKSKLQITVADQIAAIKLLHLPPFAPRRRRI